MLIRRALMTLASAFLLVTLPARAQPAQEPTIDTIIKRGTMMVGMSTFVPWAMRDKDGKLIGFEVDVATKLASDLGVKLDLVPTAWDGIIPALLAGKFDVIIGGMTITTKRNLTVNFSSPYDYAGSSLAVSTSLQNGFKLDSAELAERHDRLPARHHRVQQRRRIFPQGHAAPVRRRGRHRPGGAERQCHRFRRERTAAQPLGGAENPSKLFAPLSQEQELNRLPAGMAVRKGDVDTLNVLDNWIAANSKFLRARRHYWFETQDWRSAVGG